MHSIVSFVLAHRTISALIAYYFASAFLGSLPAPDATSSKFYRFLFTFANTFAANLVRAFATKLPSGAVNTAQNAAVEPPTISLPPGSLVQQKPNEPAVVILPATPPGMDPKTAELIRANIFRGIPKS